MQRVEHNLTVFALSQGGQHTFALVSGGKECGEKTVPVVREGEGDATVQFGRGQLLDSGGVPLLRQ
jgi:hypothetical protein